MTAPPRRSARSRKVNARYANDGWQEDVLRLLRGSSESSGPASVVSTEEPLQADDDFNEQTSLAVLTNADEQGDNVSVASGSSKSSLVFTPREENDEDDLSVAMSEAVSEDERGNITRKPKCKQPAHLHARGISSVERGRSVKGGVWQSMFGPEVEDLQPMLEAKERWLYNVRDVTLPSWKSMEEARKKEWREQSQRNEDIDVDVEVNPGLADDTSPASNEQNCQIFSFFDEQQRLNRISLDDAKSRLFLCRTVDHRVVLGPWTKQEAYDLPFMKPISMGQAWKVRKGAADSSYHSGWLLNVGEKPQHLAWSRCQVQGQYLALVCRSTPQQRKAVPKPNTNTSPAFCPSSGYPLSIQIWKFTTVQGNATKSSMDDTSPPRLVQILACTFGDIKQMAWAPESVNWGSAEAATRLGMLTLVTTDGCARLIHVPRQDPLSFEPICVEILSSAVKIDPPSDSIFTCFAFASHTDLILGASSGHIHIYNLAQTATLNGKAEPYYSLQLHHTFVMSLATLEDQYSHILASTAAAGTIQLTDLRSPIQDVLSIPRARIPTRNLVCNPHSRAFITTIDSSGNTEPRGNAQTTIVAHNLRHFYSSMALSKFPEGSGTATALAGSPLHPCILMGNSGGTVWAQNVVRRILPTGKPGAKNDGGAWVQKVVEYEWIPRISASNQQETAFQNTNTTHKEYIDLHHGTSVRPGISRMQHGFNPEKLDLSNIGSRKRKAPASGPNGESAISVIYEEEQSVTAIEWNPNPTAAGWCAIGWGSGVVWITDLGHEAT